jgi:hypothetical protein
MVLAAAFAGIAALIMGRIVANGHSRGEEGVEGLVLYDAGDEKVDGGPTQSEDCHGGFEHGKEEERDEGPWWCKYVRNKKSEGEDTYMICRGRLLYHRSG